MNECSLVRRFQVWETKLNQMGYKVSVLDNGFYIHNSKGTIVADILTVDGIRGFAQAIEWSNETEN